jgi:hypothetical protein
MPQAEAPWRGARCLVPGSLIAQLRSCVSLSCSRITPELTGEPFSPGTTHMCVDTESIHAGGSPWSRRHQFSRRRTG